ncbi:MAG: replication protein [Rhizobiales bacterium]|nr:replication protein [Hyphomicrobiales bacterium]
MVDRGKDIQTENGFVRIHPAILELLAKQDLTGREFRCLLFLFRKTYGYHKRGDTISLAQWSDGTGMSKSNICNTLKSLVSKGILKQTQTGPKRPIMWEFNKYFEGWKNAESVIPMDNSCIAESVIPMDNSLEPSIIPMDNRSVIPDHECTKDKRKGENRVTPSSDYFGMKRPYRAEAIAADGFTQDAARCGVDAKTFRQITDALLDATGLKALVDAGDESKLRYAKNDALVLIRLGTKTVEQVTTLAAAYKTANAWRTTPPKTSDLSAYASQLLAAPTIAESKSTVNGFTLSDIGD